MAALQAAVATAWAQVKPASNTAVNALQGAIDTALAGSSAVVTAWMDAWYEQQYWAAVETNLAAGAAGGDKAWNDRYVELSKTSPAQATTNPVTMLVISNSSASSLTQAQTTLTTLTATKTTADALVASLK